MYFDKSVVLLQKTLIVIFRIIAFLAIFLPASTSFWLPNN